MTTMVQKLHNNNILTKKPLLQCQHCCCYCFDMLHQYHTRNDTTTAGTLHSFVHTCFSVRSHQLSWEHFFRSGIAAGMMHHILVFCAVLLFGFGSIFICAGVASWRFTGICIIIIICFFLF